MKKTMFIIAALIITALSCFAGESSTVGGSIVSIDLLQQIAVWYGVACVFFNALTGFVSTVVKKTPGESDDAAVDKFYESKIYKMVAWVFSWGDYLAEFVVKNRKV